MITEAIIRCLEGFSTLKVRYSALYVRLLMYCYFSRHAPQVRQNAQTWGDRTRRPSYPYQRIETIPLL
jgi:hypothetical protein